MAWDPGRLGLVSKRFTSFFHSTSKKQMLWGVEVWYFGGNNYGTL